MSAIAVSTLHQVGKAHRLALGTAQFGLPYGVANTQGQVPMAMVESMLKFAADSCIDTIDTAIGYGDSERVLGSIGVSAFKIVSKLTPLPVAVADAGDWVMREIEASLARLKVDRLHGLLLHHSADLHGASGFALYSAMQKLKSEGRVKKIGISIYSPAELDNCIGKYDFDLIQSPFNLVDHRLQVSGWLSRLKAQGCEVHVRSAFLQGLLLMPRAAIPSKFERWKTTWNAWHRWLLQHDADAVSACMEYPLSFVQIDRVVVGANNLEQLRQITAAVGGNDVKLLFPDLGCTDENLINPSRWPEL